MRGPRAIIFDGGGTLWHWPRKDPTRDGPWFWGRAYDHAIHALPDPAPLTRVGREAFAGSMVGAETEYRRRARAEGSSQTPQGITADGFRRLGIRPLEEEIKAVLDGYGRGASGWAAPFPDTAPTLSRLRDAGYRTGILSNTWWSSRWLDGDLRNLGLAGLFDEILYTSNLPHAKPHPYVFAEAARRLDVEPAACVMVGDDPLCDVFGAGRAGMKTVWKRASAPDAGLDGAAPSEVVTRLAQLPALLRRGLG